MGSTISNIYDKIREHGSEENYLEALESATEFDRIYRDLLPCPFCGGKPRDDVWIGPIPDTGHWYIKCGHCGCNMKHDRRDKVISIWNHRKIETL